MATARFDQEQQFLRTFCTQYDQFQPQQNIPRLDLEKIKAIALNIFRNTSSKAPLVFTKDLAKQLQLSLQTVTQWQEEIAPIVERVIKKTSHL